MINLSLNAAIRSILIKDVSIQCYEGLRGLVAIRSPS